MGIRLQIGWPLESLPNQEGFQFRGVTENGDMIPCIVLRDSDGMHYAASASDGERIYSVLRGWMQWLPHNQANGRMSSSWSTQA